ncbi:MAG TPA: pitrilysin family protein [Casimicrobiaceae bacterium]|nr:pitrilysin family protein [Casimicrobiaceae bacterium]
MAFSLTRFGGRLIAAAFLAVAAVSATAALPAGVAQGASIEGFTEYTLANGLRVLLFPDETKPTVTVNVTYLVGSRYENYGETGMAHLLEHLMFKGTPSNPGVFQELGRRGMRFNGSTSFDRTNYFETFTASDENLDWALKMEADRMVNSFIARKDLDSEMTVVRNEYESGENDPQQVLWGRMQAAAFDWHNYAHTAIGARSDIENVDIPRLQAFYHLYYQPDNAVLIVAGHFDPDRTLGMIAKVFGAIPKPARKLPTFYTEEPVQDGERTVTVRRVGGTQWIAALYHTVRGAHPDAVAVRALGEIMTVEPAGRLYKSLVETRKASAVEVLTLGLADPGDIIFWAQVPLGDSIDTARDAMLATVEGVGGDPITQAEVDRVRAKALRHFDETFNDPQRLGVAISESIALGDWRLFFLQRDRWRTVTAADVQRVAVAYLKPSNRTVGMFIPDAKPDRAPSPGPVDVAAMVKDYKGDSGVSAGEAFDPTPANLDARTQRFTLPNGMKVAFLPKKTRGETVRFVLRVHYGDESSLKGMSPRGTLAASMLSAGTLKRNRQAFEDRLDELRSRLTFSGGETGTTAQGDTRRTSLPDLLRLTAEAFTEPAFPPEEFEKQKREQLAALDEQRTEPESIAERALERWNNPYPKDDVRYTPTFDEEAAEISAATLDQVKAFYAKFVGGANAELAVVGDFDPATIRALTTEIFGAWKSPSPYARVPNPYRAPVPTVLSATTPDKANAALFGKLPLQINDQSADMPALMVADRILGESTESRIPDRVRVRDGLSYSIQTWLSVSNFEANTPLNLYAIYAPQNRDRVTTGISEEMARALKDGFTEKEVATAKVALMQARRLARTQDAGLAEGLVLQSHLGRTWDFAAKTDAGIEAVTVASANAALRRYLDPVKFAWSYAGDFKGK